MYRAKASAPLAVASLTPSQLALLKSKCTQSSHWAHPPDDQKAALATFKAEVKTHFRAIQLRRCCYCSIELHASHKTFDLEHVLSQRHFAEFMFELINLAAACTSCNGSKGQKDVLAAKWAESCPDSVPTTSDDYVFVHPHYDEWQDHLAFDEFLRIIAANGSRKGSNTIKICGIDKVNAARIADHFGATDHANVEKLLRNLWSTTNKTKRQATVEILQEIANRTGLTSAKAIVESLTSPD